MGSRDFEGVWRVCDQAFGDIDGNAENARSENAGLENARPICRVGKCRTGKCGKRHCMEHRVFLMSAQFYRMRPLSKGATFKRGCSCTQCLSDRGELTTIAAISSNQTYAVQNSSLQSTIHTVYCLLRPSRQFPGAHAVPKMVPQIQMQRTTTKSATTATATSLSQLSMNRSRRTYARCVWFSSATHDLLLCRAGTSVSVLPASLNLSNELAVAQYAALTSAWSCICSGSDMLLKLSVYCLRTIYVQCFCHCVWHFFRFNNADDYPNDVSFTSDNYVR